MNIQDDFSDTTKLFHLGQYQKGLQKISQSIIMYPGHSMLYSNRALFYFQIKRYQQALGDLFKSIQINYLNYIAYFNLFSIQLRLGLQREAFDDLCCGLSILYFLRGKTKKSQLDVQKSLKYCQNNIQAHILKAMMHLQSGKLKLAANQIQWALEFQPQNIVLKRLRYFLYEKLGALDDISEEVKQNPFLTKQKPQPVKRGRLQCSLEIQEQQSIDDLIRQKLQQFTIIYNDLNCETGTITQRILIENDENNETTILSQMSGIYYYEEMKDYEKRKQMMKQQKRQNLLNEQSFDNHKEEIKQGNQILQAQYQGHSNCQNEGQQEQIIYDNIVLKEFDPQIQQQNEQNLTQNNFYQEIQTQNHNKTEQISNQINFINQEQTKENEFQQQYYESQNQNQQNYFIINQREEMVHEQDNLQNQQSNYIPFEILAKKFSKKDLNKEISQQKEEKYHQLTKNQQFLEFHYNNIVLKEQQVILPEPKVVDFNDQQNMNQENIQKVHEQLQTKPSFKQVNCLTQQQNLLLSHTGFIQKPIIELQQTQNTGQHTDQYSDAILSYSSQTKQNYGQILTKENINMKFHESQVLDINQNNGNNHNQNNQMTLIDDLISEASHKNQQKNSESSQDFIKKKTIAQKLEEIKKKVTKTKSLDNTMKKRDEIIINYDLTENDIKKQQDDIMVNNNFKIQLKTIPIRQTIQLYPFTLPKKLIYFNFINVQLSKKFKTSQLNQLYLVAIYHLSIPKYKMKTQAKKLQGTVCAWNEEFPQMNLLQQVQNVKIKVFNKAKGMKKRDEIVGEAERAVSQTGEVRLGLYDKKVLVGYVRYAVWCM